MGVRVPDLHYEVDADVRHDRKRPVRDWFGVCSGLQRDLSFAHAFGNGCAIVYRNSGRERVCEDSAKVIYAQVEGDGLV